ncbi:hypothetical protein GTS_16010 [Gandjariella thermophila]|uniref:Uncharacterized protein n=1 Tax=Gandjariella thermophila TaxID=1931992 RepID=A0A4D4J5F5_9PSEU|nr:hypothetical protein GTS_16010 [Gandjariella thermophila]
MRPAASRPREQHPDHREPDVPGREALRGTVRFAADHGIRPTAHVVVGLAAEDIVGGGRLGARRYAPQVATHNIPALRLYTRLGGVEHHRYRYWIPRP